MSARVEPLDLPGARGLRFAGGEGMPPWVDVELTDRAALPRLTALVGPGGSVMIAYGLGPTERALRRGVPPPATPLGLALLQAGCRWFKDWSFAEGGREGPAKLQGSVPLDGRRRRTAERELAAELAAFLDRGAGGPEDRERARRALAAVRRAASG